jgi:septal ring factor EnvC (AmiA/AmiB activator)
MKQTISTALEVLKKDKEYSDQISMLEKVNTGITDLKIVSTKDEQEAAGVVINLKQAEKKLKDRLSFYIEGAEQTVKRFKSEFKPTFDLITEIKTKINSKMVEFRRQVEEQARREEEKMQAELRKKEAEARKKQADLQAKLDAEENEKKRAQIQNQIQKQEIKAESAAVELPSMAPKKTTCTENGTLTYKKIKKWREVDFSLIPKDYLVINDSKVTGAMRAGIPIPGIEYYEESIPSYR